MSAGDDSIPFQPLGSADLLLALIEVRIELRSSNLLLARLGTYLERHATGEQKAEITSIVDAALELDTALLSRLKKLFEKGGLPWLEQMLSD